MAYEPNNYGYNFDDTVDEVAGIGKWIKRAGRVVTSPIRTSATVASKLARGDITGAARSAIAGALEVTRAGKRAKRLARGSVPLGRRGAKIRVRGGRVSVQTPRGTIRLGKKAKHRRRQRRVVRALPKARVTPRVVKPVAAVFPGVRVMRPELAKLGHQLKRAATQRQATHEHLTLVQQRDFRRQVVSDLTQIKRKLAPGDRDRLDRVVRVIMSRG